MNNNLKKVLRNLDKICLDPMGDLSNAELMKNLIYRDATDYWYSKKPRPEGISIVEIEGEKISLDQFKGDDYQEIRQAIINEIKKNSQEYWIENEGGGIVIKHKSGRKHWKDGFYWGRQHPQEWAEVEAVLKKSPTPQQENSPNKGEKKQYNSADYLGTWVVIIFLGLILAIITFALVKKCKKKST